ncbi:MAG: hypothetical protein DMF62_02425 [Acidobacteria bacterium]|nr:MAG: hypothetical protein DMF62_02425 [Acidobacteriota bacterium]
MDILEAAQQLTGVSWNLRKGVLEQAEDESPRQKPPSMEELKALVDEVAYVSLRASEYPPLSDYVDAVWHEKNGDPEPIAAYWQKVEAVKAKYPKPEAGEFARRT